MPQLAISWCGYSSSPLLAIASRKCYAGRLNLRCCWSWPWSQHIFKPPSSEVTRLHLWPPPLAASLFYIAVSKCLQHASPVVSVTSVPHCVDPPTLRISHRARGPASTVNTPGDSLVRMRPYNAMADSSALPRSAYNTAADLVKSPPPAGLQHRLATPPLDFTPHQLTIAQQWL